MPTNPCDASKYRKLSFNPDDIAYREDDPDRLLPDVFIGGGGMLRWVRDGKDRFSSGFTKVPANAHWASFFWYNEFWIITEGTGQIVVENRVTGEKTEDTVTAGDAVFLPEGCYISAKSLDADWVYFFCAVPGGKAIQSWLEKMSTSDLADVQLRD